MSWLNDKPKQLCREFSAKGKCKYGDKCTYSHGPSFEETVHVNEADILACIMLFQRSEGRRPGFKKTYAHCQRRWPTVCCCCCPPSLAFSLPSSHPPL